MIRAAAVVPLAYLLGAASAYAQTDAAVVARLTPIVHACEKLPENGGTFQQALCYRDEAARQDRELNRIWTAVLERSTPIRRASLRRDERRWIKSRDDGCRKEASEYMNSTASYIFNTCVANETVRRIIHLEAIR